MKNGKIFQLVLSCLIFALGIIFLRNASALPKCHISKYNLYKIDTLPLVKGYIISQPQLKNDRTSFLFKVDLIQLANFSQTCCGNILVNVKGNKDLHYLDTLILRSYLYRNSQSVYLSNQKIYSIMNVKEYVRIGKHKGSFFKSFALRLKDNMKNIISLYLSGASAGILEAMILGDKSNVPQFIYNSMIKSGTVHILVVSGFNVGITVFIIILFLKLLRITRGIRLFFSIPLIILYCFMSGASNPVVRATVMAIVFLLAPLFKRDSDMYNSLGLSVIFILTINPLQLFDIGFQLSFLSVLSIIYLYPRLKRILHTDKIKNRCLIYLVDGCLVSFSAWLGTCLAVARYFKIFSPITILANLFIVPLASLITLCGFNLILIHLIYQPMAPYFAVTIRLIIAVLFNINAFFIGLPGAYFCLP